MEPEHHFETWLLLNICSLHKASPLQDTQVPDRKSTWSFRVRVTHELGALVTSIQTLAEGTWEHLRDFHFAPSSNHSPLQSQHKKIGARHLKTKLPRLGAQLVSDFKSNPLAVWNRSASNQFNFRYDLIATLILNRFRQRSVFSHGLGREVQFQDFLRERPGFRELLQERSFQSEIFFWGDGSQAFGFRWRLLHIHGPCYFTPRDPEPRAFGSWFGRCGFWERWWHI